MPIHILISTRPEIKSQHHSLSPLFFLSLHCNPQRTAPATPPHHQTSKQPTHLLRILLPHGPLHLPQTLTNEQNPINQQPIRGPLDLEVPEKRIGAEEREDFVERVVRLVISVDVEL